MKTALPGCRFVPNLGRCPIRSPAGAVEKTARLLSRSPPTPSSDSSYPTMQNLHKKTARDNAVTRLLRFGTTPSPYPSVPSFTFRNLTKYARRYRSVPVRQDASDFEAPGDSWLASIPQ